MKKTCPRCGGTGVVDNDRERGQFFRGLRIESGLAQREVARRTGFSVGYICDLEHGRRAWNLKVTEAYKKAIKRPLPPGPPDPPKHPLDKPVA